MEYGILNTEYGTQLAGTSLACRWKEDNIGGEIIRHAVVQGRAAHCAHNLSGLPVVQCHHSADHVQHLHRTVQGLPVWRVWMVQTQGLGVLPDSHGLRVARHHADK